MIADTKVSKLRDLLPDRWTPVETASFLRVFSRSPLSRIVSIVLYCLFSWKGGGPFRVPLTHSVPRGKVICVRILGLDVGSRTVGVALSDETRLLASPLLTIRRTGVARDVGEVVRLASEHEVSVIVVGMPFELSGRIGFSARRVSGFIDALKKQWTGQVETWDERMSTVAAERSLLEADMSRRRRKTVVDKVAAAIILQGYLDATRSKL